MIRRFRLLVLFLALSASAAVGQRVKLVDRSAERRVDVMAGGRLLTSYRWGGDFYRPALFPIMSPMGNFITRGFPFETRDGDSVDHPHQVGCWLAYANVDGTDFWNSSKFRTAKEMEKMGRIVHVRLVSKQSSGNFAEFLTDAEWVKPNVQIVLRERTRYTFRAHGDERLIDRDTTLTASTGDVIFGDSKDGMFGLHLASELEQDDQADVKVTTAAGNISTGRPKELLSGKFWDSQGHQSEKAIWGTVGRWAAVSGRIGNEDVTVAILDHPQNPFSPTRMMIRGYGLFALNPFGQKQFDALLDERKFTLAKGKSLRFRYRIVIASTERISVEDAYRAFASKR